MVAEYHARAIAELRNSKLVAVQSRNPANAERIANIAGGCAMYTEVDALLERDDVDVVCICTPSGAHMEPAVAAARAGKHVVVEKPLEITLARCDRLIDACDRAGVQLATIFPSRFSAANQLLKQAIEKGKFGRLTLGDTYVKWWRSQAYYDSGAWRGTWDLDGGGALMNQAIHNVDLLYWLMGDVAEICGFTGTLAHERIDVEDVAVASLRFQNGALGVIEAATSAYPGLAKRTEIHGDRGSAAVEQDDVTLWRFEPETRSDRAIQKKLLGRARGGAGASDPRGITHAGHAAQLRDFVQALDRGTRPLVDGREGRKSVEIVLAIYRAARTGKSIQLPLK
jgi:predicted dehydrogenase